MWTKKKNMKRWKKRGHIYTGIYNYYIYIKRKKNQFGRGRIKRFVNCFGISNHNNKLKLRIAIGNGGEQKFQP